MAPKDLAPLHLPRCFPLWPGLLAGLLTSVVLYEVRTLPVVAEHLPAALVHPLSLAGQGLLLAALVTLGGDWRRLRAGRRDLRRLEQHDGDTWAGAALVDDLLAAGFPERLQTLPASPEHARETEEALDADCAAAFTARVQRWLVRLRRRGRRYWLLAVLLLLPGCALTALGLYGAAFGPRRDELFLPPAVAAGETVVVCLLALWLRRGWQRLLAGWRRQAAGREVQLALFPDLVLPCGLPAGHAVEHPEAGGGVNGHCGSAADTAAAAPAGEPVPVLEWIDLPAEGEETPPARPRQGDAGPTKLAAVRPTVLGGPEGPPPPKRRPPVTPLQGDLQLVEDDEA
jgi:hypothetical protein